MPSVKLITGYVPIARHPRTPEEYGRYGEKLAQIRKVPVKAYYDQIAGCWMATKLGDMPKMPTHSEGDNPPKNTLDYHIVQHQKIEWLNRAAMEDDETDVFVWVDYGVFRLPGVTVDGIEKFALEAAKCKRVTIPGCWDKAGDITDLFPNWRFCGTVAIVPRKYVAQFNRLVKDNLLEHVYRTGNVWWEVNTWAFAERHSVMPINWYRADHNGTLFSALGEDDDEQ